VTKCETLEEPKTFFFFTTKQQTLFLYWPWKKWHSTKVCVCVFRTDIHTSNKIHPQVVVAIFPSTYLPCALHEYIITPTCTPYLLLRKQSREDKNILWMMRMIFERHPCCGTTTSMSTNAMECVPRSLVCVPRSSAWIESTLTNLGFTLILHRPFFAFEMYTHLIRWFLSFVNFQYQFC
jgi:hypothetical protein